MKYLFVLLACLILIYSCSREKNEIVIGSIMNLSGDAGVYGQWASKGVDIAVEEINSSGGINGKKLSILYEDDQADPVKAVSAFQKINSTRHIQAIIGPLGSSSTLAVAEMANRNKVVIISPIASSPKITDAGDYVFRVWPSDNVEGTLMAEFAKNKLGIKKIAIYYMNNDYGLGIKNVFKSKFTELGGIISFSEAFNTKQNDFRTSLNKIKLAEPSAIYIPGHVEEISNILKQIKELGIHTQVLTTSAVDGPEIIKTARNAAENLIFTSPSFNPDSKDKTIQDFQKKYNLKFGVQAETVAAHAYDAAMILFKTIKEVGNNSVSIKDKLYTTKDYKGVTGLMSFDKNGDIQKPALVKKIVNGEIQIIAQQ